MLHAPNEEITHEMVRYDGAPGRFIFVPEPQADRLAANLRVYDASRSATNFGTEIPVVRERDFRDQLALLGIPIVPRFRTKLRVYSTRSTQLRVTSSSGAQFDVQLLPGRGLDDPAYAEFDVDASGSGTIDLRIHHAPSPLPVVPPQFWAFATVTNNETHVLTTISPQP